MIGNGKILAVAFLTTTALSGVAFAEDWNGPFIGLKAGYTGLGSNFTDSGFPVNKDATLSGGLLGVRGGFNAQLDNGLVLGLVGDFSFSNASGSGLFFGAGSPFKLDLRNLGTAQVRAGMTLGADNNTLLFVNGGLAFAQVDLSGYPGSASRSHMGFVIGAGIEHKLSDAISIQADLSYVDLGKQTYNPGEAVKLNGLVASVGVNFHF